MEQLISWAVVVCGIFIVIYSLNGLRVKRIRGYNKWKMRVIKKEAKPKAYWFNLISILIFGIAVIIFGILLVNYYN